MDEFKKYVQQHAEELEIDTPGDAVWTKIKSGTGNHPAKPKVIQMIWRIAAAAAVVTVFFIAIHTTDKFKTVEKITAPTLATTPTVNVFVDTIVMDKTATKEQKIEDAPVENNHRVRKKSTKEKQYELMNAFKENYNQLVNYQLNNIRSTPVYAETPAYFDDFKIRLKQMDADENAVRKNISAHGINNDLLEQLINIYQQKLDVLKSLQKEIIKMNSKIKLEQSSTDSLNKFYLNI